MPILRAISYLRSTLGFPEQHPILVSFDMASHIVSLLIPLVYVGVLHMKFQKIGDMLEIISHSSLLQFPDKYLIVSETLIEFLQHLNTY